MNRRQLISKLFTGTLASLFGANAFSNLKEKEMIPNVVISMPSQLFTLAMKFQAASNGKIYIGEIDTDPTLPENQIQVYLENEDGSHIPVPQPLIINQAGFPVYNGQIAKFVTVEGHSMAVYDSYGVQQHYYPNVLKYDPDQFKDKLLSGDGAYKIGYGSSTVGGYLDVTSEGKLITDLVSDLNKNNRSEIYGYKGNVFVPKNITVRCNLLPDDDVSIFKGEGKILTRDPWGNEHIFDVSLANNGSKFNVSDVINQHARSKKRCSVGVIGDSITDGAYSKDWSPNPTDSSGNLSSTNYNHNLNGGRGAWFRTFTDWMNVIVSHEENVFDAFNCSSSGKRLGDGWAYRNFDHGFFKNSAYGNKAPNICYLAMGVNDNDIIESIGFDKYLFMFEQFIKKAWGYGCAVCLVSLNKNSYEWAYLEGAVKKGLSSILSSVEIMDLSIATTDVYTDIGSFNLSDIAKRPNTNIMDQTHPSTIGHQYIGSYAAKIVMSDRLFFAKKGKCLVPSVTNSLFSIGYPSNKKYQPSMTVLSGNSYLNSLSAWSFVEPSSENLTFRYFVWVDDKNLAINTFNAIAPSNTSTPSSTCRVLCNDVRNENYISVKTSDASISGKDEKKVSYCGVLKKGLNKVDIIIGGEPTKAYPHALIFDNDIQEAFFGKAYIKLGRNSVSTTYGRNKVFLSDFTSSYDVSSVSNEAPDYYEGSPSRLVQRVSFSKLPVGYGVIFNHKMSSKSGLMIVRINSGVDIYSLYDGVASKIQTSVCDVSGTTSIVKTFNSITITQSNNTDLNIDVSGYTGGGISIINHTGSNETAGISESAIYFI